MREKSVLQKIIDLLEANGYHVFKAEEEMTDRGGISGYGPTGIIQLRISLYMEQKC